MSALSPLLRTFALAASVLVGLVLALFNIFSLQSGFSTVSGGLPSEAIARVGNKEITWRRYREVLSDIDRDQRAPLTSKDRMFALRRLIDEQLLIDRALELNLTDSVPDVRKSLAGAVLAHVSAEASAVVADEDELLNLYETERQFFSQPARYGVRWFRRSGVDIADRSEMTQLQQQLQNGTARSTDLVTARFVEVQELPASPMPASVLSNYLGGSLTSAVEALAVGKYSNPAFYNNAWHIVLLTERLPGQIASFEELRPVVEAEFKRRNANEALKNYLTWLADRTDITIDPDFD